MYLPPHFRQHDIEAIHRAIRATRLATLVTHGPSGLFASHLPMMLNEEPKPYGRLLCHVSRGNEQWRHGGEALAIFTGPDAYLSPAFYATTRETGKTVPTWNYVAVHAHGTLQAIEDRTELLALVTRLTDLHETGREAPWRVSDAPAEYIRSQLDGIVGLTFVIERLYGKWKMSQHAEDADAAGAIEALESSSDALDRATAQVMRDSRKRKTSGD